MEEIIQIIQDFDWSPLWISLKTGIVATVICFFLGIWLARQVIRLGPKAKAILDGILKSSECGHEVMIEIPEE